VKLEIPFDLYGQDWLAVQFLGKALLGFAEENPRFAEPFLRTVTNELYWRLALVKGHRQDRPRATVSLELEEREAAWALAALEVMIRALRQKADGPAPAGERWCASAANLAARLQVSLAAAFSADISEALRVSN